MEKERPDALEMAEKKDEEIQKKKAEAKDLIIHR
jgi:hypothetical protein